MFQLEALWRRAELNKAHRMALRMSLEADFRWSVRSLRAIFLILSRCCTLYIAGTGSENSRLGISSAFEAFQN
jgi:hypothetical protein